MPMYHYGFAGPWPERRMDRTYCAYCGRQHCDWLTSCEGCGAPVTAPGRIDALQAHLDEFDRVEVTTFGDSHPQYIDIPRRDPLPPPSHMVRR